MSETDVWGVARAVTWDTAAMSPPPLTGIWVLAGASRVMPMWPEAEEGDSIRSGFL